MGKTSTIYFFKHCACDLLLKFSYLRSAKSMSSSTSLAFLQHKLSYKTTISYLITCWLFFILFLSKGFAYCHLPKLWCIRPHNRYDDDFIIVWSITLIWAQHLLPLINLFSWFYLYYQFIAYFQLTHFNLFFYALLQYFHLCFFIVTFIRYCAWYS